MSLDKQLTYPLYVSVRLQVVTPLASSKKENDGDSVIPTDIVPKDT